MAASIWHTVVLPQPVSPTRSTGSLNWQALPKIKHNSMLKHPKQLWVRQLLSQLNIVLLLHIQEM
jgi:hypothetical protein